MAEGRIEIGDRVVVTGGRLRGWWGKVIADAGGGLAVVETPSEVQRRVSLVRFSHLGPDPSPRDSKMREPGDIGYRMK